MMDRTIIDRGDKATVETETIISLTFGYIHARIKHCKEQYKHYGNRYGTF